MRKLKLILEDLETPKETKEELNENAIAGMINTAIIDEWEAISTYQSIIQSAKSKGLEESFINIIQDILDEEMIHVGQLQQALILANEDVEKFVQGAEETNNMIDK